MFCHYTRDVQIVDIIEMAALNDVKSTALDGGNKVFLEIDFV